MDNKRQVSRKLLSLPSRGNSSRWQYFSVLNMTLLQLLCFSLTFTSAASAERARSRYDGYKVFRVSSAGNGSQVNEIISKLSLSTWKNTVATVGYADVVVPPAQVQRFEENTSNLETLVMHEDL